MDDERTLQITLHSAGTSSTVVVAKCTRCRLVASRLIDESNSNMAAVVGAEALAALGCAHVDAVTLSRRKTIG